MYPLARGTGPLLTFAGAVLILHERPTIISLSGIVLIVSGILVICGGLKFLMRRSVRSGLKWGLTTGFIISSYTLVDGYAFATVGLSPYLVEYAGNLFRTIVLTFGMIQTFRLDSAAVAAEYRRCWKAALAVSILMPAAYILVLYAIRVAPVSHVAPARELSMMIGAWMGGRFLGEGNVTRRIAGSCLIALGVAALALA